MESRNAKANTVSAENQLESSQYVKITENGGKLKILFAGNSITRHAPAPEIGWYGDWGMAASSEDNDYVHQFVRMFSQKYGEVDYCVAQCSKWESDYTNGKEVLNRYYKKARDFKADIVIVRLGENINREKNAQISCKPYYDEMIKYFKSNDNAKVIITDNFWNIPVLDEIFKEVIAENGYILQTRRS